MCCVGRMVGVGALGRLLEVMIIPRRGGFTSQTAREYDIAFTVSILQNR
jgi:hypothetical protein